MKFFLYRKHRRIVAKWNRATDLADHSLNSVCGAVDAHRGYRRVFQGSDNFIYLGDNLVAHMPVGIPASPSTPVIQLALILRYPYFQAPDTPKTENLVNLSLGGVPLAINAAEFLERCRQSGLPVSAAGAEQIRYTVDIGAVSVECLMEEPLSPPERAFPAAIRYGFQLETNRRGLSPKLEVV